MHGAENHAENNALWKYDSEYYEIDNLSNNFFSQIYKGAFLLFPSIYRYLKALVRLSLVKLGLDPPLIVIEGFLVPYF